MTDGKRHIVKYIVLAAVALAVALCIALIQGLFGMTDKIAIMRSLTDCFSVSGAVLLLVGLIVVCSNGGAYDIAGFSVKKFFSIFQSAEKRNKETYADYRARKSENKRSFLEFFIVGGAFYVIGMAFLIAYYSI